MADVMVLLEQMRNASGAPETVGLPDDVIARFVERDNTLTQAIEEASVKQKQLSDTDLMMNESELVEKLQI